MRRLQDQAIDYNFILSGQHKHTIQDILANFSIEHEPDFVLYDGKDITGIVQMAKWAMDIIQTYKNKKNTDIFRNDRNGIVLNHGDTFSTLLGSYLGKNHGLHSGHVESGLRSHNPFHPFPEELTRIMTFRLSDYYYAPGEWAAGNLAKYSGNVINTGHNTLYDSLQYSPEVPQLQDNEPYGLISIHRFENIFSRKQLSRIVNQLTDDRQHKIKKLFILHKPTEIKLKQYGLLKVLENCPDIELRPRYDYFTFISLLKSSEFLISDGGSNQEECSYLGKPCFLMRKATERKEGLGKNVVLGQYDHQSYLDFIKNYQQYETAPLVLDQSPTDIIVDSIVEFKKLKSDCFRAKEIFLSVRYH